KSGKSDTVSLAGGSIVIGDIDLGGNDNLAGGVFDTLTINGGAKIYGDITGVEKLNFVLTGDAIDTPIVQVRNQLGSLVDSNSEVSATLSPAQMGSYALASYEGNISGFSAFQIRVNDELTLSFSGQRMGILSTGVAVLLEFEEKKGVTTVSLVTGTPRG
ncbi:MAG: hypothetical protein PHS41_11105, partial [Victivallaceae bacterium]|nr:hypothetical protein [Victivallaceae bacterium]